MWDDQLVAHGTYLVMRRQAVMTSLDELAQVAGMSSFHFAREFKRTTGTAPHQYLMKFRVERAKAPSTSNTQPHSSSSSWTGQVMASPRSSARSD